MRPFRPRAASSEGKAWKKSRVQAGLLIRRIDGYKLVEDQYGVSYLFVLGWRPDRTKVDKEKYPLSGYLNWKALAAAGLSITEGHDGRTESHAVRRAR